MQGTNETNDTPIQFAYIRLDTLRIKISTPIMRYGIYGNSHNGCVVFDRKCVMPD